MEDDLILKKWKTASIIFLMENNLNFSKMEDDLKLFQVDLIFFNVRQPEFLKNARRIMQTKTI